tara:strand:- start:547 stop:1440 length:894 start_codon:yes stop_codon:yes gene_type:complete
MGKENFSYSYWRSSRNLWNEQLLREKKITNSYILKKLFIVTITFIFISCGINRKVIVEKESSKKNKIESKIDSQTITKAEKNYTNKEKIEFYINRYSSVARTEMKAYGIPASITLAQGILESGMGYGRLAKEGNNHFGIKCHKDWKGDRIYHDDDKKGECFRVYNDPASSYRDHSLFLKTRSRYDFLFEIKTNNYKAWAKGLKKAGYATDPKYPEKLISLIERFELNKFDLKKPKKTEEISLDGYETNRQIHNVSKGDTLYSISKKYEISLESLIKINKIENQTIYLGQKLKIPVKN